MKILSRIRKWWSTTPVSPVHSDLPEEAEKTPPAEPRPEGLWPKGKYQQDAKTFAELAALSNRQAKIRAMEIAAGDSLTEQELALKKIQEKFCQVASETRVDVQPAPAPPIVLEVDAEVLPRTQSSPSPTLPGKERAPRDCPPSPGSSALAVKSPAPPGPLALPPERSIDAILHELLHETKWLTAAEREKLNRAYEMEKHRAGLAHNPDPTKPMVFRKFVPPERPPGFWTMSNTNRMWYCRMEELWTFRQEDAAKAALQAPPAVLSIEAPAPRKKAKGRKRLKS